MIFSRTRTSWLLFITGASFVALTACSSSSSAQPQGLTAAQIGVEYKTEVTTLKLPPGKAFPDKKYDIHGAFQAGVGRNDADAYWWCSWGERYLTTSGATQQGALKELQTIKQKYIYTTSYDANTKALTDKQLSAAALDDPGPLRQDHQVNCA